MKNINPKTLNPFGLGFEYPTFKEVKTVINKSNYTGAQVAELLGVNSRYVRAIQSGEERIKYSEWRLLCALTGLIKINTLPNGPKCFVVLYIQDGRLWATNQGDNLNDDCQIIGNSTILIPFKYDNKQYYIDDLIEQISGSDEPIKAFGKLALEQFNQAGGLSAIWNHKE